MKIEVTEQGDIVLKEVFSGVLLETTEGNRIGICARDDTFEINVFPKGAKDHCWQRVNMQTKTIEVMDSLIESDHLSDPEGENS